MNYPAMADVLQNQQKFGIDQHKLIFFFEHIYYGNIIITVTVNAFCSSFYLLRCSSFKYCLNKNIAIWPKWYTVAGLFMFQVSKHNDIPLLLTNSLDGRRADTAKFLIYAVPFLLG